LVTQVAAWPLCDLRVLEPEAMSREQLLVVIGEQAGQIAALRALNEELATKLARVEHLLSRNSGNSSMPPSRDDDPGRTPPAARQRGGGPKRSRGKQPGAPGANLAWVERPDDQQEFPQGRCECGHDLGEATDLGVVDRYQQHEIPQVSVKVTQYDQHAMRCGCGIVHTARRPEGARAGPVGYGPLCRIRHNGPYAERPVMPRRRGWLLMLSSG
jgi:hypothetical protein